MKEIPRKEYSELFGPTTGDKVRLADTALMVEVEKDLLVHGDECVFGGGKTLRDGLGMAPGFTSEMGALDLVITNVLIIDPVLGIVKADLGIKNGLIAGVGKAGNRRRMRPPSKGTESQVRHDSCWVGEPAEMRDETTGSAPSQTCAAQHRLAARNLPTRPSAMG